MKISVAIGKTYENGQTDGMKMYRIEEKDGIGFVFATNSKDARSKAKAGLFIQNRNAYTHAKHSLFTK
jgi:hypothetical protein